MKISLICVVSLILLPIIESSAQGDIGNQDILFHDCVPDLVLSESQKNILIDINQDGTQDLEFVFTAKSGGDLTTVASINSDCEYAFLFFYESNYSTDSLTSDSLSWNRGGLPWADFLYHDKLGIRFTYNHQYYYGWLRGVEERVNFIRTLTIDKYAICTIPNYPLLWGQTETVGKNELKDTGNVKVYATRQNNIIVQAGEEIKSIQLLNISGTAIRRWKPNPSKNSSLNVSDIRHGAYLVEVTLINNKMYTEKIVL